MYEMREVKCETEGELKIFCSACLSSDRNLTAIGEYALIFHAIVDDPRPLSQISLCWECMSLLRKIIIFKNRVLSAQKILNNKELTFKQLSTLSTSTTNVTTEIVYEEKPPERYFEIETIIKTEPADDIDDHFDNIDDSEVVVKDECKTVVKKESELHNVTRQSRQYSFVYGDKVTCTEFKINAVEVYEWMTKEKFNEFYKNFKYKCNVCLCSWSLKTSLMLHMNKYHYEGQGMYQCELCACRFRTKCLLSYHVQKHYVAWECNACEYRCYTKTNMQYHLKMHHKHVRCLQCDMRFINIKFFHRHFKAMHAKFVCDHCHKHYRSKYMISKHMSRHHVTDHKCGYCGKRYKSSKSLQSHYVLVHSRSDTEHSYCVHCDRQFDNVHMYRRHLRTGAAHATDRPPRQKKSFPCPECNNVYTRNIYMRNHYTYVHMKQGKFYCVDCQKHFLNRTRYVEHRQKKHEGISKEKNKLCNICGRGFTTNRILTNHIRTHTGERPFECEYCAAKFTQKQAMLSHVKYIHMKSKRRPDWQDLYPCGDGERMLSPTRDGKRVNSC